MKRPRISNTRTMESRPTSPRRRSLCSGVGRAAAVLVALAAVGACSGCERKAEEFQLPPGVTGVEADLLREFYGSYSKEAPPISGQRVIELEAAPTELPLIDGRSLRVWAYNGSVPGPVIRMRLGEELRVAFTNRLPQPTTIHWHGVRVPNAMDGVPGVTQPPIEPGESFTYQFVPKDAGTFWFHPHVRTSEQIERGLYGVLVVEDAEPPPWSRDVVWVLDDWLLARDGQISAQFTTRHDLAHDGRWGNVITVNGSIHEELVVRPGERIRLRLLNSANGRMFTPDFGDLDVRVIAVDGMYTERPLDAQGFELAPGNRLDLDITIGAEQRGRRLEIIDRFTRRPFSLATIVVRDEPPVATPSFPSLARGRIPAWSAALEAPLTKEYRLNARAGGRFGIEWTIDGQAYPEHTIQSLPEGRWAKVRFVNESYRLHPMHIHGQFFKLLTRDGEPADEPFWRDTVLLHRKESVEIGLVPVDIGKWMLHCHILEHAEAGMMTVVDVE